MDEKNIRPADFNQLCASWSLEPEADLRSENQQEWLLNMLELRIRHLLEHDFQLLVNAMYRLDIPEHKFHEAMALPGLKEISVALARIVLDREMIRIEWRKKYGSGNQGSHTS